MGPVEEFDPEKATKYWFKQKKRAAHATTKCRQQDWFKGVFKEAGSQEKAHQKIIEF